MSKKLIYSVSARDGVDGHVKSTLSSMNLYVKNRIFGKTIREILNEDNRLDLEFRQQFGSAIENCTEPVIIMRSVDSKTITGIFTIGITIGHGMPKYLKSLNIEFCDDEKKVTKAVPNIVNLSVEVIIIQNK